MGTWGPGLYSSDMAADLRSTVAAVARLPLDADGLVSVLVDQHPDVANTPDDEDHTTFWLVVADQLHRKGIAAPSAFARARALVADGTDAACMASLGMSPGDLRKRARALDALAARLAEPPPLKRRRTLKRPQPLLFTPGEVLAVPVSGRQVHNPYMGDPTDFEVTGWTLATILTADHAFGYLAVYGLLALRSGETPAARPTLDDARATGPWSVELPGTCSRTHRRRLGLQTLGVIDLDADAVQRVAGPVLRWRTACAVSDISISNRLSVGPPWPQTVTTPSLATVTRA